jgi:uncharacterized protein GlcG (DUF336 family)
VPGAFLLGKIALAGAEGRDMSELSLAAAQLIVASTLAYARANGIKPLGVAVLDVRGALVAYAGEDGSSLGRWHVALGKASGAIGMGIGSRSLAKRGREAPQFVNAVGQVFPGGLIPVPGGVLIRSSTGALLGAVGVSGDTSDRDEEAALAGIAAAGFTGDPGSDA